VQIVALDDLPAHLCAVTLCAVTPATACELARDPAQRARRLLALARLELPVVVAVEAREQHLPERGARRLWGETARRTDVFVGPGERRGEQERSDDGSELHAFLDATLRGPVKLGSCVWQCSRSL